VSAIDLAIQLIGTLTLRPYVFGFLAIFLIAGVRDLGRARTVGFLFWGGGVAVVAEMFLGNVPFFSPLSFPFLAYAAFCLARRTLGPGWATTRAGRLRMVAVSGLLMMLLDVVIDPLAVRGERWFLGHIFYYPDGGLYFGVPLSNFVGWLVVGWITVGGFVRVGAAPGRETPDPGAPGLGIVLYYLVLAVNLTVTLWIGEALIAAAGIVVHAVLFLLLYSVNRVTVGRWSAESLSAPVASGGGTRP
jgi:putative membrane protein